MKVSKKQSTILIFSLLFMVFANYTAFSQTIISGTVTDANGTPIIGANVYLDGTYDGASSDEAGNFSFETIETDV